MAQRLIQCANCGARYKIPETMKAAKARCKGCGATIEIETSLVTGDAAQRQPARKERAAPEPKPEPARRSARGAGRPEGGRSGRRGAAGGRAEAAAGHRPRAGRARGGRPAGGRAAAARGARRGRGRGEDDEPQTSRAPLIIGISAGVIALGVAAFFVFRGHGGAEPQPSKQPVARSDTASGGAAERTADAGKKSGPGAAETGNIGKGEGKPAEATSGAGGEAGVAAATGDAEKASDGGAKTAKKPAKPKKPEPKKITAFDAKTLEPTPWAPDTTEEEKKELAELAKTAMEEFGIQGQRAVKKLVETGRKAFPAIVNVLRTANYMDTDEALQAFGLHKAIEEILLGDNVGFKPPTPGEDVKQEDAWWNAKCVRTLQQFWARRDSGDKANWAEYIKLRRKKRRGGG